MPLRIRTRADNRQLAPDETQFESVRGAISAEPVSGEPSVIRICTVRGIASRQAQFADLDLEALDAFITHLQAKRAILCGSGSPSVA